MIKPVGPFLLPIVVTVACIITSGCEDISRELQLEKQLESERTKNRSLTDKVEILTDNISAKNAQLDNLLKLKPNRLSKLFTLKKITIGSHSGGIDTDKKPGHDAIKILIKPVDKDGHVLKTAGDVTIRFFDLASEKSEEILLAEFNFPVEKIGKHWSGGLFTNHYSFSCPIPEGKRPVSEITVRVAFVEYLTGKTFSAQKLCKIKLKTNQMTTPDQ